MTYQSKSLHMGAVLHLAKGCSNLLKALRTNKKSALEKLSKMVAFEWRKCHWNSACRAAFLDVDKDFIKFCLRGQQVDKGQDLGQGQFIVMKHLVLGVP